MRSLHLGHRLFLLIPFFLLRCHAQISVADSVLTQKNNVQRNGVYDHEKTLTPRTVRPGLFGKRCIRKVDGQVVAQPLYVSGIDIGGVRKNVLYVVTRKNLVYAFDADNFDQNDPHDGQVWTNPIQLIDASDSPGGRNNPYVASPLRKMDTACHQTFGPVGITSTPVIDPQSGVMFLVARFGPASGAPTPKGPPFHYLISMDIRTGQELRRILIATPSANRNTFYPEAELNRPGLLLLDKVLYIAFGAPVCDQGEDATRTQSHGWVFAYSASTLKYLDSYNTSPSGALASIWQSGHGLAADPIRKLVYAFTGNNDNPDHIALKQTGNGKDDLYHTSRTDLGESMLKFHLDAGSKFAYDPTYVNPVVEHFTAGNWYRLDSGYHCPAESKNQSCPPAVAGQPPPRYPAKQPPENDSDLGSGGPVVLSNGFVIGGGKQGRMYVIDPSNAQTIRKARQGFTAAFNTWHSGSTTTCNTNAPTSGCSISTGDYDFGQAWGPNIHGAPAVWEHAQQSYGYLYLMGEKDYLRAYRINPGGQIVENAEMTSQPAERPNRPPMRAPDGMPGGAISVSSNGGQDGIVWVSFAPNDASTSIQPGVLIAFDALTLEPLWWDDDNTISYAKFVPPTIAGGKVFRASFGNQADAGCTQEKNNRSCGSIVIYAPNPATKIIRRVPSQLNRLK